MLSAVALVAAGAVGYAAWNEPAPTTVGAGCGLAVLAGLLWATRSRFTGTEVTIEDGVLLVVKGTSRHRFPLTTTHPPIDVLGSPGDRGWKVLIQRRGMRPFVIDRRMVDPAAFTEALRRYRPAR